MAGIGTKEIKDALWSQLEELKRTDVRSMNAMDREMMLKKQQQMLECTKQMTDVIKVELSAFQTYSRLQGVKVSENVAKHFGIIENV